MFYGGYDTGVDSDGDSTTNYAYFNWEQPPQDKGELNEIYAYSVGVLLDPPEQEGKVWKKYLASRNYNGKLTVTVNVNKALSNLGLTALLLLGFSTLVIGNVSVFMKILSEAIKESHTDFIW